MTDTVALESLSTEMIEDMLLNHTYEFTYTPTLWNPETRAYEKGEPLVEEMHLEAWYDVVDFLYGTSKEPAIVGGLQFAEVENFGGEGQGDQMYIVFSVSDGVTTRYFKKSGYYQSHYGSEWDGSLDEVAPKQKTVTVWE